MRERRHDGECKRRTKRTDKGAIVNQQRGNGKLDIDPTGLERQKTLPLRLTVEIKRIMKDLAELRDRNIEMKLIDVGGCQTHELVPKLEANV